ncbi:MAG: M23 family metallopeptidase [Candidatus Aenigmarchaeota archaeon]|nr:M23 family metallopeptidase [Candidatus Aenigmarchaeota archaeon]
MTYGLIIMTGIVLVLTFVVNEDAIAGSARQEKMVLDSLQIIKTSDTFTLLQKSLRNTWTVSTIQSVFQTGDEAIGCGLQGGRPAGFKEKYWLQTDAAIEKSTAASSGQELYESLLPKGLYGSGNPMTCIPDDEQLSSYLKAKMISLGNFRKFEANGLTIEIKNVNPKITATDKGIEGLMKHDVIVSAGSCENAVCTYGPLENKFLVETEFKRMRLSAEAITKLLLGLSVSFTEKLSSGSNELYRHEFRYQDDWAPRFVGIAATQSADDYLKKFTNSNKDGLLDILLLRNPGNLEKAVINVNYRTRPELIVPTESGVLPAGAGLYLHYDANVKITEGGSASSGFLKWPTKSHAITSCFGTRTLNGNQDFHGGIDIGANTGEPVYAAADGTVDFVNINPNACGGGGVCMRIRHDFGGETYYTWYMHLSSINNDLVFKRKEKVTAGEEIAKTGSTGEGTGPHLHFEMRDASDAIDKGTVNPCVLYTDDCGASTQKTCSSEPTTGSPNVKPPSAIAAFSGGNYYYFDEAKKEFLRRPFTLEFNAEDYLPAIDCTRVHPAYTEGVSNAVRVLQYRFYHWDKGSTADLVCYQGCLYTCGNADIPGMDESVCRAGGASLSGAARKMPLGEKIGDYVCGEKTSEPE